MVVKAAGQRVPSNTLFTGKGMSTMAGLNLKENTARTLSKITLTTTLSFLTAKIEMPYCSDGEKLKTQWARPKFLCLPLDGPFPDQSKSTKLDVEPAQSRNKQYCLSVFVIQGTLKLVASSYSTGMS